MKELYEDVALRNVWEDGDEEEVIDEEKWPDSMRKSFDEVLEAYHAEREEKASIQAELAKRDASNRELVEELNSEYMNLQAQLDKAESKIKLLEKENKSATKALAQARMQIVNDQEEHETLYIEKDEELLQLEQRCHHHKIKMEEAKEELVSEKEDRRLAEIEFQSTHNELMAALSQAQEKIASSRRDCEQSDQQEESSKMLKKKSDEKINGHLWYFKKSTSKININQSRSASTSQNILPLTDEEEAEAAAAAATSEKSLSKDVALKNAMDYNRKLSRLSFPEYDVEDHDEFCDQIANEVEFALGHGVKDKDIAAYLVAHIKKTNLRRSFSAQLGKNFTPDTDKVIEALRKCQRAKMNLDGRDRFMLLKPKHEEQYFDFVKRLENFFDEHEVANDSRKEEMVKNQILNGIPGLPDYFQNTVRYWPNFDTLADLIQKEMILRGKPYHISKPNNTHLPSSSGHNPQTNRQTGRNNRRTMHPLMDETVPAGMQSQAPINMQLQEQIQDQQRQHNQIGQHTSNSWQPESIPLVCRKCRQEGHYRIDCVNRSFCTVCKRSGHQNRSHKRHMKR